MFKLLIALALSLFVTVTFARDKGVKTDKPVMCFPVKNFLKDLKDKYGEEPMLVGATTNMDDVGVSVYINKDTGTYTIFEFDTEAACVLSVGKNIRYRLPKLGMSL
jgi:hypothetical protein